jgi:hypothetical protein
MTDPSADAFLPTMIEVHAHPSWAMVAKSKPMDRTAVEIVVVRTGFLLAIVVRPRIHIFCIKMRLEVAEPSCRRAEADPQTDRGKTGHAA